MPQTQQMLLLAELPIGLSWQLPVRQLFSVHERCEWQRRPMQGKSQIRARPQAARAKTLRAAEALASRSNLTADERWKLVRQMPEAAEQTRLATESSCRASLLSRA